MQGDEAEKNVFPCCLSSDCVGVATLTSTWGMSQGIIKTDQVLVLLNRLAVSEASSQSPEGEHLLGEYLVASQRQYDKDPFHNSHFHMDIEGQDPRRWSHMGKVHKDRRQSQNTQPAAALRIVLGDQRDSIIGERKLRQALLSQCSEDIMVGHQVTDAFAACLQNNR